MQRVKFMRSYHIVFKLDKDIIVLLNILKIFVTNPANKKSWLHYY
jgi:hypothetical protein